MAHPKRIGSIVADLIARRGYARVIAATTCAEAWATAAGPQLVKFSRAGEIKRGVLEVLVANSTMMQEMTFQKTMLVKKLGELMPDEKIRDVKFRVGPIS
jgi:predicted nucleic acid-binding Zn ribbon protein